MRSARYLNLVQQRVTREAGQDTDEPRDETDGEAMNAGDVSDDGEAGR